MAVLSYREVLPRTLSHKFGESPNAERKYVATLDGATDTQTIINEIGIFHGSAHPEFSYLLCLNVAVSETDAFHAEVTYSYAVTYTEYDANPLLRPDVWSFSTSGAAIPTFAYYSGDRLVPLVNAASEVIHGAMTDEAELRATISGNRLRFPLDIAAFVTNTLNESAYLGCPAYSWKCNGMGAQQTVEVVNGLEVRYYQITVELAYRATGWPLILIDEGWNYKEDGKLKRCYVLSKEGDEEVEVASANPVALAEDGKMLPPGSEPRLLIRRVHRAVNFATYFGTPTF